MMRTLCLGVLLALLLMVAGAGVARADGEIFIPLVAVEASAAQAAAADDVQFVSDALAQEACILFCPGHDAEGLYPAVYRWTYEVTVKNTSGSSLFLNTVHVDATMTNHWGTNTLSNYPINAGYTMQPGDEVTLEFQVANYEEPAPTITYAGFAAVVAD